MSGSSNAKDFRSTPWGVFISSPLSVALVGALITGTGGFFAFFDPLDAFAEHDRVDRWNTLSGAYTTWLINTPSFDGEKLLLFAGEERNGEWRVSILLPIGEDFWVDLTAPRGYARDVIEPMLTESSIVVVKTADLGQGSTLRSIFEGQGVTEMWLYPLNRGDNYVYFLAATTSNSPELMADFGFLAGAQRLREVFGGI